MNDALASILVPVYNKESYLPKCIESVRNQTYKNLEIILVDDGSTDNSLSICNYYAELDDRVKVIHQENQGVSSARNTSLQNCHGLYIFFVDPDDYVDTSLVQDSIEVFERRNADIVLFGMNIMQDDVCTGGRDWDVNISSSHLKVISGCIDAWELWGRAYHRKLWDGIFFNPKLRTCEDIYVAGILMEKANRVVALSKRYYYWQRAPHRSLVQMRKGQSYIDEFISWRHSEEDNSTPLFKEICHQRVMIAAAKALLKNRKDNTLTKQQESYIRHYYENHTSIPLGGAAIEFFKYQKDILSSKIMGKITDRAVKDALKMYAVNSAQNILSYDQKEALRKFVLSHSTEELHFEYRVLQQAIKHNYSFICKLVGMAINLK